MENNEKENAQVSDSQDPVVIRVRFTDKEKLNYLRYAHKQLIKLLKLIEEEFDKKCNAHNFLGSFIWDMLSADDIFSSDDDPRYDGELSKVLVKLNRLYHDDSYRKTPYQVIRNMIFESRGIIEGLIKKLGGTVESKKK